jgi:hypothetical protein
MAQAVSRRPSTAEARGSIPWQFMWDLWWRKWHWDRFFLEYFGFSLSFSFHRCSITWKNEKKNDLIIFHLHHRLASAAETFSKKCKFLQGKYDWIVEFVGYGVVEMLDWLIGRWGNW